jgi:pantetheine-phosphate adenylyltransferase/dephospho-CoA kinase
MKKAIYAFSGDPITYGHIDIIKRATKVFDEVIVGIGINLNKKYMFTLEQRTEMARRSLAGIANAHVVSFNGLLVDYAYENEIPVIIKGIRNSSDFDYEIVLHHLSESQKLDIDTFFLPARQDLSHVSSSGVKALQQEQGLIHEYVPLFVKMCLEARISGQYIIGITGEIGVGKSFVSEKLSEAGLKKNIPVHHIELDDIGHQITSTLSEPSYEKVRRCIVEKFGSEVRSGDGIINRKILGEIVFKDRNKLEELNEILYTPLLVRLRRELYLKRGIILFNAALIAESNMSYLCNNNVILVKADKESQKKRIESRNLTSDQTAKRLSSQFDEEEKKEQLLSQIKLTSQGTIWEYDNSDACDPLNIGVLFDDVLETIDIIGEMRFKSLWEKIGGSEPYQIEFERVIAEYSSKNRFYHALSHILAGLSELRQVRFFAVEPDALELAWWYHDIVYDPLSGANEEKSIDALKNCLNGSGIRKDIIDRASDLILWTKHDDIPKNIDAQIIVDIDFSIFGKSNSEFDDYEDKIRREYHMIPEEKYRKGRKEFISNLLKRKSIYTTDFFKKKYETIARINCGRLLGRL